MQHLIKQNRILKQTIEEQKHLLQDSNEEILFLEKELFRVEQKPQKALLSEVNCLRRGNDQQRKTIIKCRNEIAQLRSLLAATAYFSDVKVINKLLPKVQKILENKLLSEEQKHIQIRSLLQPARSLIMRWEDVT